MAEMIHTELLRVMEEEIEVKGKYIHGAKYSYIQSEKRMIRYSYKAYIVFEILVVLMAIINNKNLCLKKK
jgi:hypothetical protein